MNMNEVNSWSKYISWQSVTPPSRPNKWQIDICRDYLMDKPKTNKIAVLGSTIEYRELLAELGFKHVYVFERNKSFFKYITPFSKYELHETYIDGNWLNTIKKYNREFSNILSDLTSGNIPYSYRDAFYRNISSSLTTDGVFIDRILTMPIKFIDLNILIDKYSKMEISNRTINSFNCEVLFCSTLLENDKKIVDSSCFYDYLLALGIPRITDFVKACYEITPRDCIWWYSKSWDIEKANYEKYFNIEESYNEPVDSEYYGRAKLFISKRRGVKGEESEVRSRKV